jgi:hypothetical protein
MIKKEGIISYRKEENGRGREEGEEEINYF